MFSFRRKPRKSETGSPVIRHSPSLPQLDAQGIPWPEHLVDLSGIPDAPQTPPKGAAKTLFDSEVQGPIPFHVPWSSPGKPAGGPISSLYMSTPPPPSSFETRKSSHARPMLSLRKARAPTTFNVMVAGSQGTGKTSLLRLLLDTADISPTATSEQRTAMENFLRGSPKRTDFIQSTCVEICESRYDRVLLSVIDTPGLDFQEGHELKLERQVSTLVKYMDTQFSDTLSEESKVIRQSKGDQHIHLCIYMIDPKSIMSVSLRRALSSLPAKSRSEATISRQTSQPDINFVDTASDDEDDEDAQLTMSPADIRVIRRISNRANVLPVLARADSLTDDTLAEMKRVVRHDLLEAGLDFGVFGPIDIPETPSTAKPTTNGHGNGNGNGNGNGRHRGFPDAGDTSGSEEEQEERRSRPVIKLRGLRKGAQERGRSQSRSRMTLSELAARERAEPDATDADSVASVRFSASVIAKSDLGDILPFALISPERVKRRRAMKPLITPVDQQSVATDAGSGGAVPSEDGHAHSVADSTRTSPTSPSTPNSTAKHFAYLTGPPADLRGVFIRKFRWGTVDVLDPQHCDFAAMRTAVLSTHMKMLKIRTKEVLYEKYRTEKLLARRATANISEHETRKLLQDLGL